MTATVYSDNFIGGHDYAHCKTCQWSGPKYGYGAFSVSRATEAARRDAAQHNKDHHTRQPRRVCRRCMRHPAAYFHTSAASDYLIPVCRQCHEEEPNWPAS